MTSPDWVHMIVIGGGPAGLTAAMYAVQKKLSVLLISRDLGGKTNYHLQLPFVERHQLINGDEVVSRFSREIEYLDYVYVRDNVASVTAIEGGYEVTLSSGKIHKARTLVVCSGTRARLLEVPGEKDFMMRGLCYSATSYAPMFLDKTVAVVGDGELAMRSAAELAVYARKVSVIAPDPEYLKSPLGERLRALGHVEFLPGYQVVRVEGDRYARRVVVADREGEQPVEVDGVFVELNLKPRTDFLGGLCHLSEKGHIQVNTRNETSAPGVFAAGDVTDVMAEQVLVAIGEGAKAALSAYDYLIIKGYL